jgi:hypothetical protein
MRCTGGASGPSHFEPSPETLQRGPRNRIRRSQAPIRVATSLGWHRSSKTCTKPFFSVKTRVKAWYRFQGRKDSPTSKNAWSSLQERSEWYYLSIGRHLLGKVPEAELAAMPFEKVKQLARVAKAKTELPVELIERAKDPKEPRRSCGSRLTSCCITARPIIRTVRSGVSCSWEARSSFGPSRG